MKPGPGEIVIVCGKKPLSTLQAAGIAPKNRTVTSLRERPIAHNGGHYLITFDPGTIASEPTNREIIDWDVRLAHRVQTTGSTEVVSGECRYVNDFGPLIEWVEKEHKKWGRPIDVSCDLETMGFYPWYPDKDIVSISFTGPRGTADVVYLGPQQHPIELGEVNLHAQIRWLLTSEKVRLRLANGKYDLIWIAEKWGIECTNFKFDTMLVGSLIDENRSNSLNLHAKLFTDYGGYDDCVAPETKVLTADLEWVPVSEVLPGDELVGFEEFNVPNSRRRLKLAKAVSTKRLKKPGYRITFSDGRTINCSKDHGFLARRFKSGGPFAWTHAYELKVGCDVQCGAPVEQAVNERSAGYVSGLYDGEGYVDMSSEGMRSGISQRPGVVWNTYTAVMERHGLGGFYAHQKNGDGVMTSKHGGWETLRMLQLFRPQRLIDKRPFDGKCIPSGGPKITVASIEDIGEIEVVSLQTSTHTFIAEGVCSHNSFNQTQDKGAMEKIPPEKLLSYAGGDTIACQDVADVLKDELLQDEQLTKFYITVLHPAARAFEKVERRGVVVDKEKYEALGEELRTFVAKSQKEALGVLPNKMRIKYRDKIDDQLKAGKNPLTPKILKEFFFTPHGLNLKPKEVTAKTGEPSTTKSHLRQFADNPAAAHMVGILTDMDSAAKTLSTFVEGFLKHLRPDGRLHPTYFLAHGAFDGYDDDNAGTVTGRLSAKDPAIQTLPKKTKWSKRLRECFPAPPGKRVGSVDYSQGELKVVACVANEKTMLKAYEDGLDLHAVTGAKLANVDLKEFLTWKNHETADLAALFDKHRSNAKPANFGLLYGMQVEGFRTYAWANYGIKLSFEEAEQMRNAFFELYPGLLNYHETQRELVKFHEMVRTPLGRIRHLPTISSWDRSIRSQAERQAINSPIQGALTDMMIWAIALIEDAYPNSELEIVAMIHDALIAYWPEGEDELWAGRITEIMANLPLGKLGWNPQLKFTADAEAGPHLAQLSSIKFAA